MKRQPARVEDRTNRLLWGLELLSDGYASSEQAEERVLETEIESKQNRIV